MDHLYTPWRMAYIRGETKPQDGSCVFCELAKATEHPHVIARSTYVFAALNLFPYNSGHLLVLPYDHLPSQEQFSAPMLTDLMLTVNQCLAALRQLYNPAAFNLGVNLGRAAGAGIPDHYHFHIVPRWNNDASFMTSIGDTRVLPDTLENTGRELREVWKTLTLSPKPPEPNET